MLEAAWVLNPDLGSGLDQSEDIFQSGAVWGERLDGINNWKIEAENPIKKKDRLARVRLSGRCSSRQRRWY